MSKNGWINPTLRDKIREIRKSMGRVVIERRMYDDKTGRLKEFHIVSGRLKEFHFTSSRSKEFILPDLEKQKPSDGHKEWMENYLFEYQKEQQIEEFEKIRMICSVCGARIKDDKYLVLSNPDDPTNPAKYFYIHSTDVCFPRKRKIQIKRERWLDNHSKRI